MRRGQASGQGSTGRQCCREHSSPQHDNGRCQKPPCRHAPPACRGCGRGCRRRSSPTLWLARRPQSTGSNKTRTQAGSAPEALLQLGDLAARLVRQLAQLPHGRAPLVIHAAALVECLPCPACLLAGGIALQLQQAGQSNQAAGQQAEEEQCTREGTAQDTPGFSRAADVERCHRSEMPGRPVCA